MKKAFLIILINLVYLQVIAQNKNRSNNDDETTYTIKKNIPKDAPNLLVSVIPLSIDFNEPSFNLSVIPAVTFRLPGEKIFIDAYFKYAYAQVKDASYKQEDQNGTPTTKNKNLTSLGFVLTYNFKTEEKEHKYRVRIANKVITYIPAQAIKCTGVRLGLEHTTMFQRYQNNIMGVVTGKGDSAINLSNGAYYSNVHVFSLIAGISRTRIEELDITINEGKKKIKKGNHRMVRYYADVMVAPSIMFDNINVPLYRRVDSTYGTISYYNTHPVALTNMAKLPVGLRIGYEVFTSKKFSWAYGLEASLRPGYMPSSVLDNLFLTFKIGCNIGFVLGKKVEKTKRERK